MRSTRLTPFPKVTHVSRVKLCTFKRANGNLCAGHAKDGTSFCRRHAAIVLKALHVIGCDSMRTIASSWSAEEVARFKAAWESKFRPCGGEFSILKAEIPEGFPLRVEIDTEAPMGSIELRDGQGRLVGKVINIGDSE